MPYAKTSARSFVSRPLPATTQTAPRGSNRAQEERDAAGAESGRRFHHRLIDLEDRTYGLEEYFRLLQRLTMLWQCGETSHGLADGDRRIRHGAHNWQVTAKLRLDLADRHSGDD